MKTIKKTARIAGLLYLILAITGAFSMIYVPGNLMVHGDTAVTIQNIMTNKLLFQMGIVSGLACQVLFIFLVLELYKLFKAVNKKQALLMVVLVVASVPIACFNMINQFAVLLLLSDANYLSAFTPDQLNAFVMLFLDLSNKGILVAELFWGLWLFPFGLLVIKSGFIPKILGVFLIIGCFCYLLEFHMNALFPDYANAVSQIIAIPMAISELSIVLWLLIKGVKEPQPFISEVN